MKNVLSSNLKFIGIFLLAFVFTACIQQPDHSMILQLQIDSLKRKIDNSYKPGLGEFMSGIQVHHAKLWFAGTHQNWKLADFEINEIQEALESIRKYNSDRPEVKSLGMIIPAIDTLNSAIAQKSPLLFKSAFITLTNTCNNCHKATQHEFNIITIPTSPPISNQSFKPIQ